MIVSIITSIHILDFQNPMDRGMEQNVLGRHITKLFILEFSNPWHELNDQSTLTSMQFLSCDLCNTNHSGLDPPSEEVSFTGFITVHGLNEGQIETHPCGEVLARYCDHNKLWGYLNIMGMQSYKYRNCHYKDKMVIRPSYLYNGNPYTWHDGVHIIIVLCSQSLDEFGAGATVVTAIKVAPSRPACWRWMWRLRSWLRLSARGQWGHW